MLLLNRLCILSDFGQITENVTLFLVWPCLLQLENIGNFVRAIQEYGMKPHDIFEANDLFENVNHTQVQSTLITLAGMVSHSASAILSLFIYISEIVRRIVWEYLTVSKVINIKTCGAFFFFLKTNNQANSKKGISLSCVFKSCFCVLVCITSNTF